MSNINPEFMNWYYGVDADKTQSEIWYPEYNIWENIEAHHNDITLPKPDTVKDLTAEEV